MQQETEVARALLGDLDAIEDQTSSDGVKLAQANVGSGLSLFPVCRKGRQLAKQVYLF